MRKGLLCGLGITGVILSCLCIAVFGSIQELRLFSIESRTGKVRWSVPLASAKGVVTTPVVSNGTVFTKLVLNSGGRDQWKYQIAAYQSETGQQRWKQEFDSQSRATNSNLDLFSLPIATPKTLLVLLPLENSDFYNQVMVFDTQTGQYQRSPHRFFYPFATSPGVLNHSQSLIGMTFEQFPRTKVGCDQARVVLTQQDLWAREIQWSQPYPDSFCRDRWHQPGQFIAANDSTVFVSGDGKIQGWNLATRKLDIQIPEDGDKIGLIQNTVIVKHINSVKAYDSQTGQEKWRVKYPCFESSSLTNFTADAQQVYLLCYPFYRGRIESRLVAIGLDTGQVRWLSSTASSLFHIPAFTSDSVVVIDTFDTMSSGSKTYVTSLFKDDGTVRSRFPLHSNHSYRAVVTDETHIYVIDRAPRWRYWIAHWKQGWH